MTKGETRYDTSLREHSKWLVQNLEEAINERGAEHIGCMIAEPIMGAGGCIVPPPGYLRRCQQLCRANDIIFIADEVVTAFGRLGHYFASEAVFGIEPDIICFAKGVTSGYQPLGGLLISGRIDHRSYHIIVAHLQLHFYRSILSIHGQLHWH